MAARSFYSAKTVVSSFLAKEISAVSTRAVYAAAAAPKKGTKESLVKTTWMPDSKTGCYQPNDAGYASATPSPAAGAPNVMCKKGTEESSAKAAWMPDPKTGCYGPEDAGKQVDPVELRETLLKKKTRSGHE